MQPRAQALGKQEQTTEPQRGERTIAAKAALGVPFISGGAGATSPRVSVATFLSLLRSLVMFLSTQGQRPGLHSCAASRLRNTLSFYAPWRPSRPHSFPASATKKIMNRNNSGRWSSSEPK